MRVGRKKYLAPYLPLQAGELTVPPSSWAGERGQKKKCLGPPPPHETLEGRKKKKKGSENLVMWSRKRPSLHHRLLGTLDHVPRSTA